MTISSTPQSASMVQLAPSYTLPIIIVVAAIPLLLLQVWVGLVCGLFGLFLMIQAATLRLQFSDTALDIYRGATLIRCFPYAEWQTWRIFWFSVPVLFYFKEVKSIHFLPILFDPKMLKSCLEQRFPPQ
jgi:Protein of unknown function (DUF3119)